jgi:hypothetical protein
MLPTKSRVRYPMWVRITCCLVPVGCVPLVFAAAMCGVEVGWTVMMSVVALGGYVVRSII